MHRDEIRRFLRFVTGSSVNTGKEIVVLFNNLNGLAPRPIAHTCSCEMELLLTYGSCLAFASEMGAILSNDNSWIMDAI